MSIFAAVGTRALASACLLACAGSIGVPSVATSRLGHLEAARTAPGMRAGRGRHQVEHAAGRRVEQPAERQAERETPAGTIVGRVSYRGKAPSPTVVAVDFDRTVCGSSIVEESLLIGQGNGIANVVVRVEDGPVPERRPVGELAVAARGCVHRPHVQAAWAPPSGLTLRIVNDDGILHNVQAFRGETTLFNLAQPPAAGDLRIHLDARPGPIVLRCNLHPWTSGYIFLVEHPFFAVTDAAGGFRIADLPPGRYRIVAWHEKLGPVARDIEVVADVATAVSIEMATIDSEGS